MYELMQGDCRDYLDRIAKVDAIVGDPPYGGDYDTDYTRFTMGSNGHGKPSIRNHDPVIGDDEPFDPSPWLGFDKVILWGSNHFAQRLPVGTTLVWIKRFDGGFGSFLSDAEIAWMKGGYGVYCKRDTSLFGETRNRLHATQKPIDLMKWCIGLLNLPKDATICDPYMGSGTTGIAALQMGYNFIGIEITEHYFKIASKRIADAARAAAGQPKLITGHPADLDGLPMFAQLNP